MSTTHILTVQTKYLLPRKGLRDKIFQKLISYIYPEKPMLEEDHATAADPLLSLSMPDSLEKLLAELSKMSGTR